MESHDAEFREGVYVPPKVDPSIDAGVIDAPAPTKAKVILFKPSGKYYTEEEWAIPTQFEVIARGGNRGDAMIPYCMKFSADFRRIGGGAVLVETQEPWGFPHLLPGERVVED